VLAAPVLAGLVLAGLVLVGWARGGLFPCPMTTTATTAASTAIAVPQTISSRPDLR